VKKLLGILLIGLLLFLAFWAGRLTQPQTISNLENEESAELGEAWNNFIKAQEQTRQFVMSQPQFTQDQQSAAEGYRSIMYNMAGALELALHDPDLPRFSRMPDLGSKSGMDNPDNEYKMAIVDGENSYRIYGKISSSRHLYLQSVFGRPGVGDSGPGTFAGTLPWTDISFTPDGAFEVTASPTNPDDGTDWLPIETGVETILLRLTDKDWTVQTADDFVAIDRICSDCALSPPPLSASDISGALNKVSRSVHDRTVSWVKIANKVWTLMPLNKIGKPRLTPNGLTG